MLWLLTLFERLLRNKFVVTKQLLQFNIVIIILIINEQLHPFMLQKRNCTEKQKHAQSI